MRRIWSILLALLILAAPVRAAEDEKWVALTFDDGPSGALTERLLDGLAARDVKATFFVCGYRVAEYPAALQRIAAEGHEIGLHSEKHDYMQKMGYEAVLDDLTRCRAEVAECCGTQARLFRPPGGLYSETVLRASSKLDLSLIPHKMANSMNEFIKPRQRFINAVTNKPVDINRLMLLLSARKPLENLPMAYVKNSTEPIIPNSVSEKIPSSTIGFLTTFRLSRHT